MRTYQGKAGDKSKGKSKGLNQRPGAFIDARLKHIFKWLKSKRLDKKKSLYYNRNKIKGGK